MNREELRTEIDEIDRQLVELFSKRMDVSVKIAQVKKKQGIPVLDSEREQAKIREAEGLAPERYRSYIAPLYETIFSLSRSLQNKELAEGDEEC